MFQYSSQIIRLFVVTSLLVTALFLVGCSPPPPEAEAPSFAEDIAPMIHEHCGKCHYGGRVTPNLLADHALNSLMNGWVTPGDAKQSAVIHILKNKKHVSRDPLDSGQLTLLKRWIDAGARK